MIRSYDVMPAILQLLKKEKRLKTKVITKRMEAVAKAKGLGFRDRAVGHGCTYLEFKGWIPVPSFEGNERESVSGAHRSHWVRNLGPPGTSLQGL